MYALPKLEPKLEHHRRYLRLIVLLITSAIGLALLALALGQSRFSVIPVKHAAQVPVYAVATQTARALPIWVPTPSVAVTILGDSSDEAAILARVNSQSIDIATWRQVRQIDASMSAFFAVKTTEDSTQDGRRLLDQMINQEIVWQAAQDSDAVLTQVETHTALEQMVAATGRTLTDLTLELSSVGIAKLAFEEHLLRLLSIERFVASETVARQITRATLLQNLQTQAHVSFGPGIESINQNSPEITSTQPTATQPTAPPSPLSTPSAALDRTTLDDIFPVLDLAAKTSPSQPTATTITLTSITAITTTGTTDRLSGISPNLSTTHSIAAPPPSTTLNLPAFFALSRLDDGTRFTPDDLIGKPTVLSFWVSWCPYCQQQTPILIEAAARYQSQDPDASDQDASDQDASDQDTSDQDRAVQFVGINVKEDAATVQSYVTNTGINYPILLDSDGAVARAYDVSGFPVTYFLDRTGQITAQHLGALTSEALDAYLMPLLPE